MVCSIIAGFCSGGSQNWPECNFCPRGYYIYLSSVIAGFCSGGSQNWPECNVCPRGFYKDEGQDPAGRFAQCSECPVGGDGLPRTTDRTGSDSADECVIRKFSLHTNQNLNIFCKFQLDLDKNLSLITLADFFS